MATSQEDNDEQRFYKDDVIVVRDNEYTVEQVDTLPSGEVLQYRLDATSDDMAGTLKVNDDGSFVIAEYHSVDSEEITVIE